MKTSSIEISVFVCRTGIGADTVLTILHLAYLPGQPNWFVEEMLPVKLMCIQFVAHNLSKIDLNGMKQRPFMAADILFCYQRALRDRVIVIP
jgi:hypothetical protein